jgi:hypothetical protein
MEIESVTRAITVRVVSSLRVVGISVEYQVGLSWIWYQFYSRNEHFDHAEGSHRLVPHFRQENGGAPVAGLTGAPVSPRTLQLPDRLDCEPTRFQRPSLGAHRLGLATV